MILENLNAPEDQDPKGTTRANTDAPQMSANDDTEDDTKMEDDEDADDEGDYEILPSNDSGITADDNAATGRMHEKEGE